MAIGENLRQLFHNMLVEGMLTGVVYYDRGKRAFVGRAAPYTYTLKTSLPTSKQRDMRDALTPLAKGWCGLATEWVRPVRSNPDRNRDAVPKLSTPNSSLPTYLYMSLLLPTLYIRTVRFLSSIVYRMR